MELSSSNSNTGHSKKVEYRKTSAAWRQLGGSLEASTVEREASETKFASIDCVGGNRGEAFLQVMRKKRRRIYSDRPLVSLLYSPPRPFHGST